MPQVGGFCGYGIADEDAWNESNLGPEADPDKWLLRNINGSSQLFLFRGTYPRALFNASFGDFSRIAIGRWQGWFGESTELNTHCFFNTATDSQDDFASEIGTTPQVGK